MKRLVALAVVLVFTFALGLSSFAQTDEPMNYDAEARLLDANGTEVGVVHFMELEDGKVEVHTMITALPIGFHGFHIHQTGITMEVIYPCYM